MTLKTDSETHECVSPWVWGLYMCTVFCSRLEGVMYICQKATLVIVNILNRCDMFFKHEILQSELALLGLVFALRINLEDA